MAERPSVLLIGNDDPSNVLEEILREHCNLTTFRNLDQLKASENCAYDAAFLSWGLDTQGSMDLARMRKLLPDVPVLALCRLGDKKSWAAALGAGADDFLVAPYFKEDVLPALIAAISWRHARRELRSPYRRSMGKVVNG